MKLENLQHCFNRALLHSFGVGKLSFVSGVLLLCGLLLLFCRALALTAGEWVVLSLTFLPILLSGGFLLATGILLIRLYYNEVRRRDEGLMEVLQKSWEIAIGASYFSVPIVVTYLVMWMCLGLFLLLRDLPGLGTFFSVILAFGPFLLNLGALLLCLLTLGLLFFVAPAVALRSADPRTVSETVVSRLRYDPFANVLFSGIALLPFLAMAGLLAIAAAITGATYIDAESPVQHVLQWFFVMVPFALLLSPAVVFFFNLAAESHVLLRQKLLSGPGGR